MNLKILESSIQPSTRIVSFKGRFDASTVDEIETTLDQMIKKGEVPFILDLKMVSYIGSGGIRVLLSTNQKLKERAGKFAIINVPSSGMKIIQAMELESFFNIFSSEQDAVRFVSSGS